MFGGGAGSLLGHRLAALQNVLLLPQACVILLELVEFVFRVRYAGRVNWSQGAGTSRTMTGAFSASS
ncbi:hypothetical protein GCM10020001_112360 [Nonomuraea salmonea]